ncbi:MAG: PrgI family protein [Chloroflexi bacterium]|nr:MAG: PrgI family protein [Chloroflexota bacterium]
MPAPAYLRSVPARIPLDVDLEDKLLYGLTPTRLVYLIVALLAGFSAWTSHWAPVPARAFVALMVALVGVVAAWGRWRGRPIDGWATDLFAFCTSEYRVLWKRPRLPRWRFRRVA